jgi:hypothetical protein
MCMKVLKIRQQTKHPIQISFTVTFGSTFVTRGLRQISFSDIWLSLHQHLSMKPFLLTKAGRFFLCHIFHSRGFTLLPPSDLPNSKYLGDLMSKSIINDENDEIVMISCECVRCHAIFEKRVKKICCNCRGLEEKKNDS